MFDDAELGRFSPVTMTPPRVLAVAFERIRESGVAGTGISLAVPSRRFQATEADLVELLARAARRVGRLLGLRGAPPPIEAARAGSTHHLSAFKRKVLSS
jgi:hypothetical protein